MKLVFVLRVICALIEAIIKLIVKTRDKDDLSRMEKQYLNDIANRLSETKAYCSIADTILSQDPENPDDQGKDVGKIEFIGLDIPLIQFT
ncbi:MAG: hypothetical protein IJ898_03095 [Prevotella sp.]|jgi:hypothetical protein|nr:hypothetical protein [Prevotella sp.]